MNNNNFCVIMAGGIGSRFWPISQTSKPKQFLDIFNSGKTLLQQTFERFVSFIPKENIFIVTGSQYEQITLDQLPFITKEQVLLEPFQRNTAPCIAYANEKIRRLNPDANIIVAASDHIIQDQDNFRGVMERGLDFVSQNDALVTIGLRPTRPDTGYGYIQFKEENADLKSIYKVKTFTEKPNLELAEMFLKSGDFLWNSGMFIWNLKTITEAFEEFLPDLNTHFGELKSLSSAEIEMVYSMCKGISIDYGIMEKAQNVYVLEADFDWSDLGTWSSLHDFSEKDNLNNVGANDNILVYDTENCTINVSSDKKVVIEGLDGYIVAETKDCLLICRKSNEQHIREFVSDIKKNFGDTFV